MLVNCIFHPGFWCSLSLLSVPLQGSQASEPKVKFHEAAPAPTLPKSPPEAVLTEESRPADVFLQMSRNFNAQKAKAIKAAYQFQISGVAGGSWWITVNDGTFKMGTGAVANPDVTLICSDRDWVSLATGSLGGTRAFFSGRLKIHGSQTLSRRLDEMFP
jgi:putative sterol carrier protein